VVAGEEVLMTAAELATLKQRALYAFQRDLPQLYARRPREWVAYQEDRQVGFASQKHLLYHHCFDLGLQGGEFVVFCIEPEETEMTLGPVVLD
jgi:hypothetical protein